MIDANEKRVERILAMLAEVRSKRLSCFGSDSHQFRLNKPLSEQELVQFESKHGITLPADFRCFLQTVGNGGAGPYYGIYPLASCEFIDEMKGDIPSDILARPCPLHLRMSRDEDWQSQFPDCVSPFQGVISLGTQGCTQMMGLIVTGKHVGRVVYMDLEGYAPYVVREPDFLAWYLRWLDELLEGYDLHWFGFGIGGDENSLTAILKSPTAIVSERTEAVQALQRLPELSDAGRKLIGELIADDSPDVRAAACWAAEKFNMKNAVPAMRTLLHDHSPEVQQAAIHASMKLLPEAATNFVLPLIDSSNEKVAESAFFALKEQGKLYRETLLRLVVSTPHDNLRHYATHTIDWKPEDGPLLIRLLSDPHEYVRLYATRGLHEIAVHNAPAAVIDLLSREDDRLVINSILQLLGEVPGGNNGDVLLPWANHKDDDHRLTAVDSLCKLGDLRVEPIAKAMLQETRSPMREDEFGLKSATNIYSIRELVAKSLRASPNRKLRQLVSSFSWPQWFRFT